MASLDLQDIRSAIFYTALEVQDDDIKDGSLRMDIDLMAGYGRLTYLGGLIRVRDYDLKNPTAAPVSHFSAEGKYIRATEVGSVTLSNKDIMDTNGKGILNTVWSESPNYDAMGAEARNCVYFVRDIMEETGVKPPSSIRKIFKDTLKSGLIMDRWYKSRTFLSRRRNMDRVAILVDETSGRSMSAMEMDPNLMARSKGGDNCGQPDSRTSDGWYQYPRRNQDAGVCRGLCRLLRERSALK